MENTDTNQNKENPVEKPMTSVSIQKNPFNSPTLIIIAAFGLLFAFIFFIFISIVGGVLLG